MGGGRPVQGGCGARASYARGVAMVRKAYPRITTTSPRKQRRLRGVGDSLLRGTEGPRCRTEPPLREACCLPGARVQGSTGKLPSLGRPTGYCPLLLFRLGGNEAATHGPRAIKRDFGALGWLGGESGTRVIFPSLLPVAGSNTGRKRRTRSVNTWVVAGVPSRVLGFPIMGWPARPQACWCQMGFAFLKGRRGSWLTS